MKFRLSDRIETTYELFDKSNFGNFPLEIEF